MLECKIRDLSERVVGRSEGVVATITVIALSAIFQFPITKVN